MRIENSFGTTKLDYDRILRNTQNYNEYETTKYIEYLVDNINSCDPYQKANVLMKRHYDYPKYMSE